MTELLFTAGRWEVRHMTVTPQKATLLWDMMQRHRTLFSDITRDDHQNFINALLSPNAMWFEVWEYDVIVGVIWFQGLQNIVDCEAHLVFFDRRPTEKTELCRRMVAWMFENTALHRITVTPPVIYKRTIKLLGSLGFSYEGRRREALLMGGNWIDQLIYGITREEVTSNGRPNRKE